MTKNQPATVNREPNAIVYCEDAFRSIDGKTTHGLVRRSHKYRILSVLDSRSAGKDAGETLDGIRRDIPIHSTLQQALSDAGRRKTTATHFILGIDPVGGRLSESMRQVILDAIESGLHIVSPLHEMLAEDATLVQLASSRGVELTDIKRVKARKELHSFTGRKIREIEALRVLVLGTDAAVGKRTTAWLLHDELIARGFTTEFVGTGQTSWLQGARYSIILDSIVYDFVPGEIEHSLWLAWKESRPRVLVIEGQGGLMSPAYGDSQLLVTSRPHVVVLQDCPTRRTYLDTDVEVDPLPAQIRGIETLGRTSVAAITINHQGIAEDQVSTVCRNIARANDITTCDVLLDGPGPILDALLAKGLLNERSLESNPGVLHLTGER